MIDYRYHAISLAAVLFALALGVLLGVAIGDSNLVSSAKSGVVENLQAEVREQRQSAAQLQGRLGEEQAFASGLYPLAVHGVLSGRNIGLVFFGPSSDRINALARGAVAQAGAAITTVIAVREPPDLGALARAAAGTRYAGLESSPGLLARAGEIVGHELADGVPPQGASLLGRLRGSLLSAFDGQLTRLEGVIVARAQPPGISAAAARADAALQSGMLAGIAAAGITAVGVELSSQSPSQVPWFKGRRISSVDDLDAPPGQAALVFALAGYRGAFGTKPSAEALLPSPPEGGQG